jgi:hypothetical protein
MAKFFLRVRDTRRQTARADISERVLHLVSPCFSLLHVSIKSGSVMIRVLVFMMSSSLTRIVIQETADCQKGNGTKSFL